MHLVFCTHFTQTQARVLASVLCFRGVTLHTSSHSHNNQLLQWVTMLHFEDYAFPEKQLIKRIFPARAAGGRRARTRSKEEADGVWDGK